MSLKEIAQEAIEVSTKGEYQIDGRTIRFLDEQTMAIANTTVYSPERIARIKPLPLNTSIPEVTVVDGTTQQVALTFSKNNRICLLNFASARNPGGGFLNGAKAQEEDLCRCSGLYPCLVQCDEYYETNRKQSSLLYTDFAIFSPSVPFFKARGTGDFLSEYFLSDVITMPAPNSHQYLSRHPNDLATLESTFRRRWGNVLRIAHDQGVSRLLLGAWGCGAFGGDPFLASRTAKQAIDEYGVGLKEIVFAIRVKKTSRCLRKHSKLERAPSSVFAAQA